MLRPHEGVCIRVGRVGKKVYGVVGGCDIVCVCVCLFLNVCVCVCLGRWMYANCTLHS